MMNSNRKIVSLGAWSCGIVMALLLATTSNAAAPKWGSLKGRFVFDGKPDKPKAISAAAKDPFCSKRDLVEESLVVSEKGGLANVFVYLYLKRGKETPIHPDLEKPSEKPVMLDNKGCRFEPHAIVVRTSQPLKISNSDIGLGHNTKADLFTNPTFNEMVSSDSPLTKVFERRETYPASFSCKIHPWMNAYVLIRDNPYMVVSDAEGCFEIKNLPAGKLEFVIWHSGDRLKKLTMGDGKANKNKTSKKGRVKLDIPAGKTLDLGEIKVDAKILGK